MKRQGKYALVLLLALSTLCLAAPLWAENTPTPDGQHEKYQYTRDIHLYAGRSVFLFRNESVTMSLGPNAESAKLKLKNTGMFWELKGKDKVTYHTGDKTDHLICMSVSPEGLYVKVHTDRKISAHQ